MCSGGLCFLEVLRWTCWSCSYLLFYTGTLLPIGDLFMVLFPGFLVCSFVASKRCGITPRCVVGNLLYNGGDITGKKAFPLKTYLTETHSHM
jgi:hypothetical protein